MTNNLNLARLDFIRSTVFLLIWMPFHSYGQIQVGQDLDGKSQGLKAGVNCAISQDGNRLVYAEQFSNGLNTGDGSLLAYEWSPSIQEWAPLGDTVHGAGLMYQLGSFSVAMSGDGRSIAGGTPFTGNTQRGIVQTYRLNSLGVWDTLGGFLMGANNFDQIGRSIAFNYNGNILAVSAENTSWGNQAGYIKVFELDSINNMWVQVGMTLQGLGVGEKFGHQIDLNDEGDVLVVGIPFRGPSLKGAVQVFRRDSTNNWVQQGSTLDRGLGYIQFGNTVSMNSEGNMFVAGSWGSANAYKAYVYKWNNTTLNWSQFGPIINPAASWREWCYDVEMDSSGYIIAVSSIFDEEARVYQYNSGSNTWGLIPSNISGRVSGDDFGGCLDLSGDGQRLIVGAPTDGLHFIEGGNVAVFSDYCSNMTKFSLSDCDSVILPNGMSVKTSGFHYDTLVNVRGCDSILRYSLLIKQPSSAIQYDTSCVSFTSNSGVLYTQSGVFQEHFTNQVGCDSTLYLHINIPYLDTSIYLNAPYLVSAAQNVTYQWYDCNSQAVILGETNVNFLPSNNGSYAVIIEKDGCSDTSNCFNLVNFGQIELTENVIVYPNPVSETIRIQYEGEIQTELVNSIGQKVLSTNKKEFDVFHLQRGLYTVVLVTGNGSVHVRKLVIK
jgi:hypothetical protein